jgi:dihydroflavonol-4-reductase
VAARRGEEEDMQVFLTGGTGFIGQALTRVLLRRRWNVIALARRPDSPQARALGNMGAQLATGDITERESMRPAMRQADLVVHSAGQYELGLDGAGRQRMQKVNVEGTENVLGLAHELGVPRAIYVSTMAAFGGTGRQPCDETSTRQAPCRTTYEETKAAAHEVARQYQQRGLPLIIVCPHHVLGTNDHTPFGYFQRLYVNRVMPPIAFAPSSIFCCVDVNDLAEGIALAAEKGRAGQTYLLCGEPLTLQEIFGIWCRETGASNIRLWLPPGLAAALFAPLEPLQRKLGLPAFISRETTRAAATNWYYSSEKAKRELGWTHRSAEVTCSSAIRGEMALLPRRKGQTLIQRLKPLETLE